MLPRQIRRSSDVRAVAAETPKWTEFVVATMPLFVPKHARTSGRYLTKTVVYRITCDTSPLPTINSFSLDFAPVRKSNNTAVQMAMRSISAFTNCNSGFKAPSRSTVIYRTVDKREAFCCVARTAIGDQLGQLVIWLFYGLHMWKMKCSEWLRSVMFASIEP
jgi:hypothetical protein